MIHAKKRETWAKRGRASQEADDGAARETGPPRTSRACGPGGGPATHEKWGFAAEPHLGSGPIAVATRCETHRTIPTQATAVQIPIDVVLIARSGKVCHCDPPRVPLRASFVDSPEVGAVRADRRRDAGPRSLRPPVRPVTAALYGRSTKGGASQCPRCPVCLHRNLRRVRDACG